MTALIEYLTVLLEYLDLLRSSWQGKASIWEAWVLPGMLLAMPPFETNVSCV